MKKKLKIALCFISIFLLLIQFNAKGQITRSITFGNLQGVKRYGVAATYFNDYEKGLAVDRIIVKRGKNYHKISVHYREKTGDSEKNTSITGRYSFGNYFGQWGKRIYFRGLVGPEIGYEEKQSLLMDEKKSFPFFGIHVGLEMEYFISKRFIFFLETSEYSHYYLSNIRLDWLATGGIRMNIF
jgi:hypothetical protein